MRWSRKRALLVLGASLVGLSAATSCGAAEVAGGEPAASGKTAVRLVGCWECGVTGGYAVAAPAPVVAVPAAPVVVYPAPIWPYYAVGYSYLPSLIYVPSYGSLSSMYWYHFRPGNYGPSGLGHYRFPYYSYRRPWYTPGVPVFNRNTDLVW